MAEALLALGLVLVAEGLLYALAPQLVEQMLEALRQLDLSARRLLGIGVLGFGVVLVWLARLWGA